ncbi:YegP family protein [Brenneria rubrifaciens]|uniref:DUF1508 domain-containing protein n=1 Tax=Brenneria rubrifaciens TaxID=55213 RepID=A0A4P8QU34_9GAMM|nr:YegP family protein [Brenneria rubrifaciens]QCR08969.1 DUF1508 domain-containing protein [Brenneria rubrifaciens]
MSGKYEIFNGKNGEFYFRLKAGNGEPILVSEGYTSKSSAKNGVASVKENSPHDSRYTRLTAKDGLFYFTLKAANHQVIGHSETYRSARSRDNGIESVKKNGPAAPTVDLT